MPPRTPAEPPRRRDPAGLSTLLSGDRSHASLDGVWSWVFHLERLAQAGVMAGGLAHDARNLLAGISGTCELALLRGDAVDARETLTRINALALQAAEAMSVFLTFARRGDVVPRPCRVGDVVADALKVLEPTIRKGQATVTTELEPDLCVHGERTLLLQALVNLVLNAVRAIGTNVGHVTIRAHRADEAGIIEVVDDGPGIAAEMMPRLFRPFGSTTSDAGGTGLGLFVTRRILEQQGGTIDVESAPGKGATFRIRLRAVLVPERRFRPKEVTP